MEIMMETTETDTIQTNLSDTITYLNQQLNELLQQQQKDNAYREEMHDQQQKLQSDYELLTLTMKALKARAELSEREVDSLKAKLIKTEDHLHSESERHRFTKDELIKTKTNLQSVKSQAMHDIRKRETEYTRFKEKMQKLLSDKYHSTCGPQGVNPPRKQVMKNTSYAPSLTGYDVGTPMVFGGLSHAEKNSEKIKQGDGDADARDKDLLQENSKLRKLLFEVHNQVVSFIGSQTSVDPELASLKTPESYNSRAAHIQLPFELFAQNLEEEVKDLLLALKFEWNNRPIGVLEDFQQKDVEIQRKDVEIRQKDVEIRQKDVEIRQKDAEIRKKDDEIRQKYEEIRQKYEEIRQKDAEIRQKDAEIRQKDVDIQQKDEEIRQKDVDIRQKDEEIRQKDEEIRQKDDEIRQKDDEIRQKDNEIMQKYNEIMQKDNEIMQKNAVIEQKEEDIQKQKQEIESLENQLEEATIFIIEEAQQLITKFSERIAVKSHV